MAGRKSRAGKGSNARQAVRRTAPGRAEAELLEREAAYDAVLTPIPEMVFRIGRDGTFLDFVPAKGQPPTLRANELVGRKVQDVLPADIAKQAMSIGERTLRTGAFQSFEYQLRVPQPDGELTSYQARLIPAGPDEVVAIVGNTTQRRRMEAALRESEERYRALFEKSADGLALVMGGKIALVNARMQEITGYDQEELFGRTPEELVAPEEREQVGTRVRELSAGGPERPAQYRIRQKNGDLVPVEVISRGIEYHGRKAILSTLRDVSERVRAEEALRESEAKWRSLVEHSPDYVMLLDREATILFINRTLSDLTIQQVIGTCAYDHIPAEYRATMKEAVDRAFESGEATQYETEYHGEDGDTRIIDARVGAVKTSGEVVAVTVSGRDITDRRRAEEALSESEERWRSLAENAPDFIMTVDREGTIQFINRTVLGLSREDVIGTNILDYVAPEYREKARRAVERVFQAGEPSSQDVRLVEEMGSAWYRSHMGPVKHNGKVVAATIVSADITDRKQMEAALRESEERFRSLSEVSFEGVAIHEDGRIIDANNAFAALAGYDRSDVIGMHALDFTAPEYHEAVIENIRAEGDEPYEVMALRQDGTQFPVELRGSSVPMGGRTVRVVAVRDLTQLKEAEAKLAQARDELEGRIERQMVRRNPYGLTFREFTVLHHVASGKADKEIARELGISPLTVQKHVASILAKMNASSRTEAGVRAVREALLD